MFGTYCKFYFRIITLVIISLPVPKGNPRWMDSDNSWNPRISSFKNKITCAEWIYRYTVTFYMKVTTWLRLNFYLFGLRKRNWFKNEYNFLELIRCAFNPYIYFFKNIITFWFLMLKYSQETLKKTVPVDIWIQDCFHVLYLTNIFLVHLLETSINT